MFKNDENHLESRIGYKFKNKELLEEALTHKSFNSFKNYERLEFLGDALLNIVVSEWLYKNHKDYNEGLLTKMRANLVNKKFLLIISKKIFIIDDIIISNSIKKNDTQAINNIFSDIMESIIGAIFIDSGMDNIKSFINRHLLSNLIQSKISNKNYKGMLVEKCHQLGYKEPIFELIELKIENKIKFQANLNVNQILYSGIGNTKKNAEINAAEEALKKI